MRIREKTIVEKMDSAERIKKLDNELKLREMDAWLAEHVMDWDRVESVLKIDRAGSFSLNSDFSEPARVMIDEGYARVKSWIPTENQGDAMDVLKKCAEKIDPDFHISISGSNVADWEVWCNDNAGTQWSGRAESLTLAICRFAFDLFKQRGTNEP